MRSVQPSSSSGRPGRPGRRGPAWLLTAAAAALVVAALNTPTALEGLGPATFLRLPLEALLYLALVLALPPRFRRTRAVVALTVGALLGVATVFRLLDIGFGEVLNRPFNPLIDWRYAQSLAETVRSSVGAGWGTALLVAAAAGVLALLVLLPLSTVRLGSVVAHHRTVAVPLVVVLLALWAAMAALDVRGGAGALAARGSVGYVHHQVTRIPVELREQQEFARAARTDPYRRVPGRDLLTGLRGKDVLFVFVESYGRVAVEGSAFSAGVVDVLDSGTKQLGQAGFSSRSAYLTSPVFGAVSWLAHATLQSGLWVDDQRRYDLLVTSRRLTLSRLFARAGWRTVASVPANTRDWPQGAFYGFDHLYDSRNVGYRGPRFGYPTMPDQYTLDAFHRLELAPGRRPPVMAEIDLISSHAPWSRTPWMLEQHTVGDGSVFDGMPDQLPSETDIWPSPHRVRAAYGEAIEYSLTALVTFITTYGDDDLVVVLMGDHQPARIVSGDDAGYDVPISVVTRDPAVLERISGWGWGAGLTPRSDAPVWRMDAFRDRFLAAYGPRRQTEAHQASPR